MATLLAFASNPVIDQRTGMIARSSQSQIFAPAESCSQIYAACGSHLNDVESSHLRTAWLSAEAARVSLTTE